MDRPPVLQMLGSCPPAPPYPPGLIGSILTADYPPPPPGKALIAQAQPSGASNSTPRNYEPMDVDIELRDVAEYLSKKHGVDAQEMLDILKLNGFGVEKMSSSVNLAEDEYERILMEQRRKNEEEIQEYKIKLRFAEENRRRLWEALYKLAVNSLKEENQRSYERNTHVSGSPNIQPSEWGDRQQQLVGMPGQSLFRGWTLGQRQPAGGSGLSQFSGWDASQHHVSPTGGVSQTPFGGQAASQRQAAGGSGQPQLSGWDASQHHVSPTGGVSQTPHMEMRGAAASQHRQLQYSQSMMDAQLVTRRSTRLGFGPRVQWGLGRIKLSETGYVRPTRTGWKIGNTKRAGWEFATPKPSGAGFTERQRAKCRRAHRRGAGARSSSPGTPAQIYAQSQFGNAPGVQRQLPI